MQYITLKMDSDYIYSASRIKALEGDLLSDIQLERLIGAKSKKEAFKVLHDTFLAPYIADKRGATLSQALDINIVDTKNLLTEIAPDKEIFAILWMRYDLYNLEVLIKGTRAGYSDEKIKERFFSAGNFSGDRLIEYARAGKLGLIDALLEKAYNKAKDVEEVYEIDIIMNVTYFRYAKAFLEKYKNNVFIVSYIRLLIDMFNLQTKLRVFAMKKENSPLDIFISGGSFREVDMQNKEAIFALLLKLGGENIWKEAISEYEKRGHFSLFEKAFDDYMANFLRECGVQIFSVATLFSYFFARKNDSMIIRTIMVAKENKMDEKELRTMLRRTYT